MTNNFDIPGVAFHVNVTQKGKFWIAKAEGHGYAALATGETREKALTRLASNVQRALMKREQDIIEQRLYAGER